MAALVAAIHVAPRIAFAGVAAAISAEPVARAGVDARDKPGRDGGGRQRSRLTTPSVMAALVAAIHVGPRIEPRQIRIATFCLRCFAEPACCLELVACPAGSIS